MIEDAIMAGAALVTMTDSAKAYLRKRSIALRAAVSERNAQHWLRHGRAIGEV